MQGHKSKAKKHGKRGGCRKLNAAIAKHGWEAFRKEVMYASVPREVLPQMEVIAIEMYQTLYPKGYNLRIGGETSPMLDPLVQKRAREVMNSKEVREKREKVFAGSPFLKRVSEGSREAWNGYSVEDRNKRAAKMAAASRKGWIEKREAKMASMTPAKARSYWLSLRQKGIDRAKLHLKKYPERYVGRDPIAELMAWWGESFDTRRRE
jgi:hypothetical protein